MSSQPTLKLPDFIAVGPPRTGTTWLDRVLRGSVGLPAGIKETQFFIWRYRLGIGWYGEHFKHCSPELPIGEICPEYFAAPQARERIAHDIPGCRIICTLRNPVERIYSHYKMWRKMGATKASFERFVMHHERLLSYNRYAFHIKEWQRSFGAENVYVSIYEDSLAGKQAYIDKLCRFIGIDTVDLSSVPREKERLLNVTHAPRSHRLARRARRIKTLAQRYRLYRLVDACDPLFEFCMTGGPKYPPLDEQMESTLIEKFRPEVEELEDLLQRDLWFWKQPDRTSDWYFAPEDRRPLLSMLPARETA